MGSPTAHSTIQTSPYTNIIPFPFKHTNVALTATKQSSTKSLYPSSTKTSTQTQTSNITAEEPEEEKELHKNTLNRKEEIANHFLKRKYNTIHHNYGFLADPNKSLHQNFNIIIKIKTNTFLYNQKIVLTTSSSTISVVNPNHQLAHTNY
jgi:hypothetical protein